MFESAQPRSDFVTRCGPKHKIVDKFTDVMQQSAVCALRENCKTHWALRQFTEAQEEIPYCRPRERAHESQDEVDFRSGQIVISKTIQVQIITQIAFCREMPDYVKVDVCFAV